ncbi:IS5 family transposase [Bradyrhizobium diazoefficiens]|nr:IS5 family transposase [Bradyrhizobium diazoefficiens]
MDRFVLTDAQWAKMEPLCLGKPGDPGRSGKNNRLFVEAVLWIARTGSPWRDLPRAFGNWITTYTRFRDWAKAGVWKRMFDAVSDEPDMEYVMVDATIVKVHRHGQGGKRGTQNQAIGRSKGGMTTKILALTDALGNLVRFMLLPGQRFDAVGVQILSTRSKLPIPLGSAVETISAISAFCGALVIAQLAQPSMIPTLHSLRLPENRAATLPSGGHYPVQHVAPEVSLGHGLYTL